jgi:hypothetical protein
MGRASPETTSYVHHADVEHRRIERLQHDPLARRQQQRRDRASLRCSQGWHERGW